MKRTSRAAVIGLVAGLTLSYIARADNLIVLATYDGTSYGIELEFVLDSTPLSAVSVDHPDTGVTDLEFDAGENQWDVFSPVPLDFADINSYLTQDFDLILQSGLGTSTYNVFAPGAVSMGDFPNRADSLVITTDTNPFRPTATWAGGDANADFSFLTYQDAVGDEFGGQIPVAAEGSSTLDQDLAPGGYEATLAYWTVISGLDIALSSGPDIFSPDPMLTGLVTVGETASFVQIVPVPAAAWLFASALGLLGWIRARRFA